MSNFENLVRCLDIKPLRNDIFEGTNLYIPTNNIYGGQFLSQSIIAASKTTSEYRLPNAIHANFFSPGDLASPTIYQVERIRDGRVYSFRDIRVKNGNVNVFRASVSFHEDENLGAKFQTIKFPNVEKPESYLTLRDVWEKDAQNKKNLWANYFVSAIPFEQRPCNPSLFKGSDKTVRETCGVIDNKVTEAHWFKIFDDDIQYYEVLKKDNLYFGVLNRAFLAFISDQFGFSIAMRQGGLNWLIKESSYASLDHAMWFYDNDIDLTKWHLIVSESPVANDARGLGYSHILKEDGKLVATFIQEGMLRAKITN